MKASDTNLLKFLKAASQFIVPIYQRNYSWTEKECYQLWHDIKKVGAAEDNLAHFLGSIVYIQEGQSQESHRAPILVIDGQQRLTSITLLLAAIGERIGQEELVDGFTKSKIFGNYLQNLAEDGERFFKLILTDTDKASLQHITGRNEPKPSIPSLRIEKNYSFFQKRVSEPETNLKEIIEGIAKLVIVDVSLTRGQDNPQLIFESMNSTGRKLSQADLIRNFVLMNVSPELQKKLYLEYWRSMERQFGQEAYSTHFDGFARYFLAAKTRTIPRLNYIYEDFKDYAKSSVNSEENLIKLVEEMYQYSVYYTKMAQGKESDRELRLVFNDLRELKVDVSYPLLLQLYDDYEKKILTKGEFIEIIRLIESYMFRRMVCEIPSSSTNQTFAGFNQNINKKDYINSVKAIFLRMKSYRRFPTDEEFTRHIKIRDLYNFRSRGYWIRRLENFDRKEYTIIDDYTIEHIMPQNENLSPMWRKELGDEWRNVHDELLHTLGNLTLTGYNSEYSDKPFVEKRDMNNGFAESSLFLNRGLAMVKVWNRESIEERANFLAKRALSVWSKPVLSEEKYDYYKNKSITKPEFSVKDFKHLTNLKNRDMFNRFRRDIMSFDPNIEEVFVKSYIAYKAEKNFAKVLPMEDGFKITLSMPYSDIQDPREICIDKTGKKVWITGDVEFEFSNFDDLNYATGLVRQAFDYQVESQQQT